MKQMRELIMKKNNEKPIVQEISERQVDDVREKVRTDVYFDMKAQVNETVNKHATNINLTQIQKIKYLDNDSLKTEINELKRLLAKSIEEIYKLDSKCQE
jgi:predicted outer membrane protein